MGDFVNKIFIVFFLFLPFQLKAHHPVEGHIDMQVHLTTYMIYQHLAGKYSPLDPLPSKPFSHKHKFRQAAYEKQLWESSTKLYVITALDEFFHPSRRSMIKAIKKQFAFVKDMAKKFPHRYAIAKTPEEAREIIHSGRKAFVLAIEGGTKLIRSQRDADYWASEGVAMIGIIHLKDNEYGSATIMRGASKMLNFGAIWAKWFRCRKKGLSRQGKKAVAWLAKAGILTDITHMEKDSILDTLDLAESLRIPVVATHSRLRSFTGEKNDLTDSMVKRIYRSGGMVGLTSGNPAPAHEDFRGFIPHNYCPESYDELGIESSYLEALMCSKKDLIIGFATDMNGMVDHYRPKYGRKGCFKRQAQVGDYFSLENRNFDNFDIYGLNHIGAVKGVWKNLERSSFNTDPFMRSAEGFLKIWENMRTKIF